MDVLVTNSLSGDGVEPLLDYITGHRTAVLVGPSGAGKSTLINALLGDLRLATREVRLSDGRGRHTTVTRELVQMPSGGVLIDTPGLRALGLTGSEAGIASVFADIDARSRADSATARTTTNRAVRSGPPSSRVRCRRSVWPPTTSS